MKPLTTMRLGSLPLLLLLAAAAAADPGGDTGGDTGGAALAARHGGGGGKRCLTAYDSASTYDVFFYSSASGKRGAGIFTFAILQTPDMDECEQAGTTLDTLADPCCGLTSDSQSLSITLDSACGDRSLRNARAWVRTGVNGTRRELELDASWGRRSNTTVTLYRLRGLDVAPQFVELQLPRDNPCAARVNASTLVAPGPWPCSPDGCDFALELRSNLTTYLEALPAFTEDMTQAERKQAVKGFPRDGCCRVTGMAELDLSNWRPEEATPPTLTALGAAGAGDLSNAPARFLVLGDWGANETGIQGINNGRGQLMVATSLNMVAGFRKPQFVVNTGDNAYECGLSGNFPTNAEYFKKRWSDMYGGANLKDLHWYSVAGNHDVFRFSNKIPAATRWKTNQNLYNASDPANSGCRRRNISFDSPECLGSKCCYSQAWQWSQYLPSEPRWHMQGGSWQAKPEADNPAVAAGLVEFFLLDTNVYIDSYFTSKDYDPNLPEGLNTWRAKRDQTEAALLDAIAQSNATWKIVVGHHTFKNYGTHCIGKGAKDCNSTQALRAKLEALKVPLYINGHDHSVQLIRLESGMLDLTSGAGAKRNAIFSRQLPPIIAPADLLYPRDRNVWGGLELVARLKAPYGYNFIAAYPDRLVIEMYEVWRPRWFPWGFITPWLGYTHRGGCFSLDRSGAVGTC